MPGRRTYDIGGASIIVEGKTTPSGRSLMSFGIRADGQAAVFVIPAHAGTVLEKTFRAIERKNENRRN